MTSVRDDRVSRFFCVLTCLEVWDQLFPVMMRSSVPCNNLGLRFYSLTSYLWIKHNEQYDIKEGPIANFMPKIETSIDAAFWVPRRSTAYLIHGDCSVIPQCCL